MQEIERSLRGSRLVDARYGSNARDRKIPLELRLVVVNVLY